jgi:DNA invertase Pin-like site-specific DNA recombinase
LISRGELIYSEVGKPPEAEMVKRRKVKDKLAVAYTRTSTDEQALSPEAQAQEIERWCAAQGYTLVAVHHDAICSTTPLEERPGLTAALDDLRAHRAGVLLVAKRDRLSRDPILTAMLERLVEREGARVESAAGVGNGHSPESQMMRRMIDAFAEYELALIRARTRAALDVKRQRGERISRFVPYGTKLAADGRTLEPEPEEAKVVALVVKLRGEKKAYREIVEVLTKRGVRSRVATPLSIVQVRNIYERNSPRGLPEEE